MDLNLYTFSKIYAGNDYPLTTQAKNEIQELFDVGPENVDFNAPGSAEQINDEVNNFTFFLFFFIFLKIKYNRNILVRHS